MQHAQQHGMKYIRNHLIPVFAFFDSRIPVPVALRVFPGILVFMLQQLYSIQKLLCFSFVAALTVGSEWTIKNN